MHWSWVNITVVAGLALVLTACGGDEPGTGDGTAGASEIEAVATDFSFTPSAWTVREGDEVTLTFRNEGDVLHEWVIITKDNTVDATDSFTEQLVLWEVEAEPGTTATETFTAPAAGSYQVICAIEGHLESGMEGRLTVTAGD
jgi:plastocyanin